MIQPVASTTLIGGFLPRENRPARVAGTNGAVARAGEFIGRSIYHIEL